MASGWQEKIAYYQEKADEARTNKNEWRKKIKDYYSQMNDAIKNSDLYKQLKGEYWNARMTCVTFSNQESSYNLDAFLEASNTKYWNLA